MTEEELEVWFAATPDEGRGATVLQHGSYWEARVFDLGGVELEGEGEGDTMIEALTEAIANYQRYVCGAV